MPVRPVSQQPAYGSFVIYGRSGTGKTTLASSWPKPMLFLDIKDHGTGSISDVKGIDVMDVKFFEDFELTYGFLKNNPKKYKTVVIDTVSQLQQMVVKERAEKEGLRDRSKTAGDWGSMTKRDWGDIAAIMKEWILNYRDLSEEGINIIFIAQDRTFNIDNEEDSGESLTPEIGPALSPSIAKVLNASVSLIGNTYIRTRVEKKEVKGKVREKEVYQYCLRVGPNPIYVTKIRKPKTAEPPATIIDPTYEDVLAATKGE